MADPKNSAYGSAGGRGAQGPLTRFEIAGDPSAYYPVWAAGSMFLTTPAFMQEARGGAYYYGPTKVGGITNLLSNGSVLYPYIGKSPNNLLSAGPLQLILGGLTGDGSGAVGQNFDALFWGRHAFLFRDVPFFGVNGPFGVVVDGEFCFRDTTTAANGYGAQMEKISLNVAGTVATTAGSGIVTGTATTFTTIQFDTGILPYTAYPPSRTKLEAGDIIEIVYAGPSSQFFRVDGVTDNTHLIVYPTPTLTQAALTYRIWRTGYGNFGHVVPIPDTANSVVWNYYAGLNRAVGLPSGTIQAVVTTPLGPGSHQMAPQTSAAADIQADDVISYKGFLLYGHGPGIGWSKGPFPTAFPFGAADFPAGNISAFNLPGTFLSFEQMGEQVLAMFDNGIFLVQATGSVPEFNFVRLPDVVGPERLRFTDQQQRGVVRHTRSTCSARNAVLFISVNGLQRLQGSTSNRISTAVENYDHPATTDCWELYHDPSMDVVLWRDSPSGSSESIAAGTRGLVSDQANDVWSQMDLVGLGNTGRTDTARAFSPWSGFPLLNSNQYRRPLMGYWLNKALYFVANEQPEVEDTDVSVTPWIWATPVISLGDIYDGFCFEGFRVMARSSKTAVAPTLLTWTVYGGSSPYQLFNRFTGTFDYTNGTVSARSLIGVKKLEDAFVGIVLTGSNWIELTGVALYDAAMDAAR